MGPGFLVDVVKKSILHHVPRLAEEPGFQRVLEALGKVDRKDFLGDTVLETMITSHLAMGTFMGQYDSLIEAYNNLTEEDSGEKMEKFFRELLPFMRYASLVLESTRQAFIPLKSLAYNDMVINIGYGQTCTQPSITAIMMHELQLEKGMNILEVGAGCGYSAAICAELIGEEGKLTTLELVPQLVDIAKINLERHFGKERYRMIEVIGGDGSMGYRPNAPYDRIYLTAGVAQADNFDKGPFIAQLKQEGILVYPEEKGLMFAERYKDGALEGEPKKVCGVQFVPLIIRDMKEPKKMQDAKNA